MPLFEAWREVAFAEVGANHFGDVVLDAARGVVELDLRLLAVVPLPPANHLLDGEALSTEDENVEVVQLDDLKSRLRERDAINGTLCDLGESVTPVPELAEREWETALLGLEGEVSHVDPRYRLDPLGPVCTELFI